MEADLGLHTVRPAVARPRKKRVGRGIASGHGKSSGRGTKGQKARSGGAKPIWFEGGQNPIYKRVPKRGFTNAPFRREWQLVNLRQLKDWPADAPVSLRTLAERRLVDAGGPPVKLLGDGEVMVALQVEVDAVSAQARAKIEAAGGSVTLPQR